VRGKVLDEYEEEIKERDMREGGGENLSWITNESTMSMLPPPPPFFSEIPPKRRVAG
jgi:hypothetical protein